MARPRKTGLNYFPHDTDAVNDEKIEILRTLYGNDGYAFYFILLERIYRTDNLELSVCDAQMFHILSNKCGISMELFEKILQSALECKCFDIEKYEKNKILTSDGIKKRGNVVIEKRLKMRQYRGSQVINKKNDEVCGGFVQHKPSTNGEFVPTKESKVKESKVKESKVKNSKEKESKEKNIKKEIYEEKKEVKKFQKPSLEEVIQYCNEIKSNINAQNFIDANDAKGWVVGKNKTPMRDWRAVIRTWEYNRRQCQNESKNIRNTIYPEL